jgi:HlyD family secretion protein
MAARLRLLTVIVLLGCGGGVYWYMTKPREESDGKVRVSGNIEVTDAQVSFKIAGRVDQRYVDEGQLVNKGDQIALLDTADLVCEVDLRRAELKAAESVLAELEAGSRVEEIATAKATMEKSQHTLDDYVAGSRPQDIKAAESNLAAAELSEHQAKIDLERSTQLVQRKAVSAEEYDRTRTNYNVAIEKRRQAEQQLSLLQEGFRKEQIEQARAALQEAKAHYDLVLAGARREVIDQAKAKVEQAKANVRLAEVRLAYSDLRSPMTGVVLSKNIEPGEYVVAGTPVVTIGDLVNVWLRAYIEQPAEHEHVKVGQKAIVTTDTGDSFEGYVSFISSEAEFTPKNVQTQKERVKLVYRIKINIVNKDMRLKPGMPADAVIDINSPAAIPPDAAPKNPSSVSVGDSVPDENTKQNPNAHVDSNANRNVNSDPSVEKSVSPAQ